MNTKSIIIFVLTLCIVLSPAMSKDCIPNKPLELIFNGDFELGDTGFSSQLRFSPLVLKNREGSYAIGTNPKLYSSNFDSCYDHTTSTGMMMIVNGALGADTLVWAQKVQSIKKNTDYELIFFYASADIARPAVMQVLINKDTIPQIAYFPIESCNWLSYKIVWNSGNSDTALIRLYDINYQQAGNDYMIDDISFKEFCTIKACADSSKSTCISKPVQLGVKVLDGFPPFQYKWTPAIYLDNPNVPNPIATVPVKTTFFIEVIDSKGCRDYDSIVCNVYSAPLATITNNKPLTMCPCDSIVLSAEAGLKYQWSNGATSQSITVNLPGPYLLTVSDSYGCTSTNQVSISTIPDSIFVKMDTIRAKSGDKVQLEIHTESENNVIFCGISDYTARLSYRASLLVPNNFTGIREIKGGIETLNVSLKTNPTQPIVLLFDAVLGDSVCTDLILSDLKFTCDSVVSRVFQGRFCLEDICKAGGVRLYRDTSPKYLKLESNMITNSEINISFGVIEPGNVAIRCYNTEGKQQLVMLNEYKQAGDYTLKSQLNTLPSGKYFIILEQNVKISTEQFIK